MNKDDVFRRVALFSDLRDEDVRFLASQATVRHFRKNTIVINAGDETDSLYVVVTGQVKIYLADARGREITLRMAGPGDCFGELAVLSEGPRAANVATVDDAQLAVIARSDFLQSLRNHPEIALGIIQSLVQRIRDMTEDVSTLALLDVYGRVAKVLVRHSSECDGERVTVPMTHQEIANLVGSSREMVTRILKDLKEGGYISTRNRQLVLEKPLPSGW